MSSAHLVWFITGTTSGFGHALTIAAHNRGDKVIATARDVSRIQDLKEKGADILQLDVTDNLDNVKAIAKKAVDIYGRIDVLVNNAAYLQIGTMEETTPEETFAQYNTNVFGLLNVCRAFLPYMRQRKSGVILQVGSKYSWDGVINCGLYTSSKFAVRGIAETMALELQPFNIRVHCIEPGYFIRTPVFNVGKRTPYISRIPDYEPITRPIEDFLVSFNEKQPGDPRKLAEVMIDIAKQEGFAAGKK
ncbi:hypothetical protein FRC02_009730 [Tulasnella sp. 418]|nr:hypothetical protein FRC02_009730 [Tulasnella sp. 418]